MRKEQATTHKNLVKLLRQQRGKHRAMYQLRLQRRNILLSLSIPIFCNLILLAMIDPLIIFWRSVLEFGVAKLDFGARVVMHSFDLGYYDLWVPSVAAQGQLPSPMTWWVTAILCAIAFVLSYLIRPDRGLPFIYILRAIILLQTTALLYFAFIPASFPHLLEDYVAANLFIGVILLALIPWILGVTFYIFDFPLVKKILITLLTLAFFIVVIPLQYLLHANLIALGSLLFMPILYLVFGLFIDVMAFIALYSYGMTRRGQAGQRQQNFHAVTQVWGTSPDKTRL
jgi:hypothetical protein